MDTKINCHTVPGAEGERCVFVESRTPKAQKLHSCDECHRIIQKGEEYRRDIMKFGTKLFHHKYCEDCLSVREVFFSNGWYYGKIWEQMWDYLYDVYWMSVGVSEHQMISVTKPARDKICDMIQEQWNEQEHEQRKLCRQRPWMGQSNN